MPEGENGRPKKIENTKKPKKNMKIHQKHQKHLTHTERAELCRRRRLVLSDLSIFRTFLVVPQDALGFWWCLEMLYSFGGASRCSILLVVPRDALLFWASKA